MIFTTLENYLRNFSFVCLFLTMLFYWTKASFFQTKKTNNIENIALLFCNISLVSILILRWIESNHFPLSNLYESLLFLSWSLVSFLLLLQLKTKEFFLGTIITPIVLFINTFANFSLPIEMQKASSLVPALQSNWLMMHVTIMMLSYAALICGSLLAITFLVIQNTISGELSYPKFRTIPSYNSSLNEIVPSSTRKSIEGNSEIISISNFENKANSLDINLKQNTNDINLRFIKDVPSDENPTTARFEDKSYNKKIILINKLDNLSYRTLGIGFPLLTIGILSGAVWANETWGSYWNWDPKETWALITWIIYAIYLHSRIIKGWKGEKPALIASFGFLAVWVCYLGVNIFGKGLHSYGWFAVS